MNDLIGVTELFDLGGLGRMLGRLGIDLVFATLLIRGVYLRLYRDREYAFTYYLLNVITFLLCLVFRTVPVELGFALGLFAVFGILRHRSEPIRIRDLTYMFIAIGLGVINAAVHGGISLIEIVAVNGVILILTALLELSPKNRLVRSSPMLYDNLELLKPGSESDLFCDLITRTGLRVERVEVDRIDLLRDAAEIRVYYIDGER